MTLGMRFDRGSDQFISSDPEKYDVMQERSGGCLQAAKAIRALSLSPPQHEEEKQERATRP